MEGKQQRLRVYQKWEGNEKFFCWGYLVAGPNWKASLGSAVLIIAPTAVFLALVAPYLTREVHAVIMVFSVILPTLSLIFLVMTACRDPGIIARQEPDEEYLSGRKPRTKEVYVNNQRVVIRYNDTCHFYQPPRAHHCSVNDNCIERFDHHCPWVGTTIGKRNYRTFLLFIYTTTVLCLYVFGCCLTMMFVKHRELKKEAEAKGESGSVWGETLGGNPEVPAAIALMVFTFLFFWFVGGLSSFHCYLVGTNQTTYENFRYNQDGRRNPYNRGLFGNCAEVWCTRIPPSQVQFRGYADEIRQQQQQAQLTMVGVASADGPQQQQLGGGQQQQGMGGGGPLVPGQQPQQQGFPSAGGAITPTTTHYNEAQQNPLYGTAASMAASSLGGHWQSPGHQSGMGQQSPHVGAVSPAVQASPAVGTASPALHPAARVGSPVVGASVGIASPGRSHGGYQGEGPAGGSLSPQHELQEG